MDMEELDILLSVAIVVAVLLNVFTTLSFVRRLPSITPQQTATTHEEENADEEDDEDNEDESETTDEPTKEQILARRAQLIHELEQERGTKVLTLIHRKEPWNKGDDEQEITLENSEEILLRVRETPPDTPIDFIVHTEGGSTFAADMIAMALKHHKGKVTVMVPFYAFSDGTYLVLAGDEVMMERYSLLAPVEPLVDDMPANWIMAVLNRKPIETIADRTVLLAETARMETENARGFVKWLLEDKMSEDQASQVANFLVGGVMASTTPITLDVARAIGLKVIEGIPEKVYQLFETIEFSGDAGSGRKYND
jgi:ClpP class serine protease